MVRFSKMVRSRFALEQRKFAVHPDVNLLLAFAERNLCADEHTEVLAHLAQCPECREVLALTTQPNAIELPVWRLQEKRSLRWWDWRFVPGAVAICLVTAIAWRSSFWKHSSEAEPVLKHIDTVATAPAAPPTLVVKESEPQITKPKQRPLHKKVIPRSEDAARTEESPSFKPLAGFASIERPQAQTLQAQNSFLAHALPAAPNRNLRAAAVMAPVHSLWSLDSPLTEGAVLKSDDGGRTWQPVRIDDQASFTALSAIGSNVWVGGPGGKLFHSMDNGLHWAMIRVADEHTRITGTITGIDAHDGLIISVKTRSGAAWVTTDGGLHWRPH
jgi:hypothetical protein